MALNPNPTVYATHKSKRRRRRAATGDADGSEPVDAAEVFELVRHVADPEHPLSLEQLHVVREELIDVKDPDNHVHIRFTPTIPHCSMATLIGLCLRVKLQRSLPARFKVDIEITPGTHSSEHDINRQLNDKERVAAALENSQLLGVVTKCIAKSDEDPDDDGTDPAATAAQILGERADDSDAMQADAADGAENDDDESINDAASDEEEKQTALEEQIERIEV